MRIVQWIVGSVVTLAVALAVASVFVSRPLFEERLDATILDDVEIAPPQIAITLARIEGTVILVQGYRHSTVTGLDLKEFGVRDALDAYQKIGLHGLQRFAATGGTTVIRTRAELLLPPFEPREQNIGVGLNYAEHARESTLDEAPFFFPKFATPTQWNASIAKAPSTLLDYEAEIGLVALRDIDERTPPELGLVLANEATDRWPLVRGLDRQKPMGTTGFGDGKSRHGFAPIGGLLVIPTDVENFCAGLEMKLWRNGQLRQHESGAAMIWKPRRIIDEILKARSVAYRYRGRDVKLLGDEGRIAAGTVIFSGTPAGVLFKPLNLFNPLVYLRPGDEVAIHADRLGVIRNAITP